MRSPLNDTGIELVEVYLGSDRVLTGTARVAQEAHERATAELRCQDHERKLRQLASKPKAIEAQIVALQAEAELEAAEVNFTIAQETLQEKSARQSADAMAQLRGGKKPLATERPKHFSHKAAQKPQNKTR